MKYIMEQPYEIKCEYYYHVTHGGDCCSNDNPQCQGLPCRVLLNDIINLRPNYYKDVEDTLGKELVNRIDNKDMLWATQNLQSNNVYKRTVAKYLIDNK